MFVICSDGTNPAPDNSSGGNSDPDLDGDGIDDIRYSASVSNIELVFSELSDLLTPSDFLFIYSTDHGGNGDISLMRAYLVYGMARLSMIQPLQDLLNQLIVAQWL
jgi:hypothetical protein